MPDFRRTLERAFRRRIVVKDTADAVVATGTSAQADEEAFGARAATSSAAGTIAVMLAGIAAFLNLYATQPLLPMLVRVFSASKAAVGMTVSAATIGVALSAPFCGLIAERVGRKRVIVTATLLLAVPTLLASTATSLPVLIFWRFLQGLVMPGIFGVAIAYIAEEWPPGRVASAMSLYVSATVLGGFLGRVVPGYAATHRIVGSIDPSWRLGFLVIGVSNLLFGAVIARWLPRDHHARAAVLRADGGVLRHLRNPRLAGHVRRRIQCPLLAGGGLHLHHLPSRRAAVSADAGTTQLALRRLSRRADRHAAGRHRHRRAARGRCSSSR